MISNLAKKLLRLNFLKQKKVSRKSSGMGRYCQQVGENGKKRPK